MISKYSKEIRSRLLAAIDSFDQIEKYHELLEIGMEAKYDKMSLLLECYLTLSSCHMEEIRHCLEKLQILLTKQKAESFDSAD